MFVIDGSGSIRHERFHEVLDFMTGVVQQLEINPDRPNKVRVAAVCFNTQAFVEFYLNTYRTKQDIIHAIQRINYLGGRTNIAGALSKMRTDIFLPYRGDREGVPNFAIVFTDGAANLDETETLPQAIAARVDGVHIVSVAVGRPLNMPELQGIASDPFEANLFTVESFDNLPGLIPQVVAALCDGRPFRAFAFPVSCLFQKKRDREKKPKLLGVTTTFCSPTKIPSLHHTIDCQLPTHQTMGMLLNLL